MKHVTAAALLVLIASLAPVAQAAEWMGAAAVIEKLDDAPAAKAPADTPAGQAQVDVITEPFAARLAAWQKKAAELAPDAAAAQWLELLNAWLAMNGRTSVGWAQLVAAIPAPPAWDAISAEIDARAMPPAGTPLAIEASLRLFAAALRGDHGSQWEAIDQMSAAAADYPEWQRADAQRQLAELRMTLALMHGNTDKILEAVTKQLAVAMPEDGGQTETLELPDLVTLLGEARAEELLRAALQLPVLVSIDAGDETRNLAQRLALEMIDVLKKPQWMLVDSLDQVSLYEALAAKFDAPAAEQNAPVQRQAGGGSWLARFFSGPSEAPQHSTEDWQLDYARSKADAHYLLGLIAAGRSEDAVRLLTSDDADRDIQLRYNAFEALEEAGFAREAYTTLQQLLESDPALPLWNSYVQLATRLDRSDEALAMVRAAVAKPELTPELRQELMLHLINATLAADHVDEAVVMIREAVRAPVQPETAYEQAKLGIGLARVGLLLERADWLDEGIHVAGEILDNAGRQSTGYYMMDMLEDQYVHLLVEVGRLAEAEAALVANLGRMINDTTRESYDPARDTRRVLINLAWVYHVAGRHGDVITLLEQAPWWGHADLLSFHDETSAGDVTIGHIAATALAAVGRRDEAMAALLVTLNESGGHDPSYNLLLELKGDAAEPLLQELYARDRFEERPLIWLAALQLSQGKLDEAEKHARAAIAIDPSDGEQGKGDRMRAYSVLAEIRRQKGDDEEAKLLDGLMVAIRMAERADDYYAARLLKRGIAMYREATLHFADAYCIQSRLAVQLAEAGSFEEAAVHYRKAYELMPSSFGRVESHCFGCEGAFDGSMARNIAEDVFTQLAVEQPDVPQVHYLLGYLRSSQGRPAAALEHYRRAVQLDADYLNAWKKIAALSQRMAIPAADRDSAVLNLARLDPLGRHTRRSFDQVNDLRAMWETIASAAVHHVEPPETMLALPAAKAAADGRSSLRDRNYHVLIHNTDHSSKEPLTPGEAVADHVLIKVAGWFINEAQQ